MRLEDGRWAQAPPGRSALCVQLIGVVNANVLRKTVPEKSRHPWLTKKDVADKKEYVYIVDTYKKYVLYYNCKEDKVLIVYSSKEILQILHDDGWIIKNQRGSHLQLIHSTKVGRVTVPHPRKELDPNTVKSIFKQAGLRL